MACIDKCYDKKGNVLFRLDNYSDVEIKYIIKQIEKKCGFTTDHEAFKEELKLICQGWANGVIQEKSAYEQIGKLLWSK